MHELEKLLKQLRSDPENAELKKRVRRWLAEHREDSKTTALLRSHWDLLDDELGERDLQQLRGTLEKIHHKVNLEPVSLKNKKNKKRRFSRHSVLKIAATLLLPILIYASIEYADSWLNSANTSELVMAKTGTQIKHFFLPDSTEVWLNSESHIKYTSDFQNNKQRLVSLSGQAFFKVYHDAEHPFVVQTSDMDIRVLGTSFDVSAYPEEQAISTVLEEGAIALSNKQGKSLDKLAAGEQAVFHRKSGTLEKIKGSSKELTSWRSGKLIFRDAGIAQVISKLERRFGYNISVSQELLEENPTYSFSIKDENIEEICQLICLATGARATIEGKHIRLEKKQKR